MNIRLQKLKLTNFKGIRSFEVEFDQVTNIHGQNASGKTTIMDAFLWLFFGKDSSDRKDFEIKTLDENNKAYEKLDHEVEAVISINGMATTIRRTLREKWVTKRGSTTKELNGHETAFFWNDIPLNETQFKDKVASVINENLFKLLTNTSYFNSIKWQDRRNVLIKLAGKIDDADVLVSVEADTKELTKALDAGKTLDEFKKEIGVKKKKLKDELLLIPSRVDEANRSIPEVVDFSKIESEISYIQSDLQGIDEKILDASKVQKERQDAVMALMKKRQDLRTTAMQIEFDEKNKVQGRKMEREQAIQNKRHELRSKEDELNRSRNDYSNLQKQKQSIEDEQARLRAKWFEINDSAIEFNDNEFACPTCKRDFDTEVINEKKTEMLANFNADKSKRLADIHANGKSKGDEVKAVDVEMSNLKAGADDIKAVIAKLTTQIANLEEQNLRLSADDEAELKKAIVDNKQYQNIQQELNAVSEVIEKPTDTDTDNSALLARKKELSLQLDNLKSKLAGKGQREKQLERIAELQKQEEKMNQELADLEGIEFSIEQFIKAKMDLLESRINGMFKLVTFKMFETQINGGQVETCITLINGVPYSDANTASKVQAGIDIINTLSGHYEVKAPVFIDNRESVTQIPDSDLQIINLIVSPAHKKLTVVNDEVETVAAPTLFS